MLLGRLRERLTNLGDRRVEVDGPCDAFGGELLEHLVEVWLQLVNGAR